MTNLQIGDPVAATRVVASSVQNVHNSILAELTAVGTADDYNYIGGIFKKFDYGLLKRDRKSNMSTYSTSCTHFNHLSETFRFVNS